MFPVEAFQQTLTKFVSILQILEIPFHITGGSISSAYGEPRLTQDIDIVVSPEIAKKTPRRFYFTDPNVGLPVLRARAAQWCLE